MQPPTLETTPKRRHFAQKYQESEHPDFTKKVVTVRSNHKQNEESDPQEVCGGKKITQQINRESTTESHKQPTKSSRINAGIPHDELFQGGGPSPTPHRSPHPGATATPPRPAVYPIRSVEGGLTTASQYYD